MVEAISTGWTTDLIKGWNFPPIIVGIVRGAIGAALAAGAGYLLVNLSSADWGDYAPFSPFVLLFLRTIEAQFDQTVDPNQNSIETIAAQKETRA